MCTKKMNNIIKVIKKEKITSIRVTERTKKELESFGNSGDSHEETLKKLIKLARNIFMDTDTEIIKNKNIIGTKYAKLSQTLHIETEKGKYSIVCKYNDLSLMNLISKNKKLQNNLSKEWEIDLEIVNISINEKKWSNPDLFYDKDKEEYLLLYFIAIKQILEEIFSITLFEITTLTDYFNINKWKSTYIRNGLSMDSFYQEIQRKIR